jgi:TonB-linked SusC/RagA family outer membrane protein
MKRLFLISFIFCLFSLAVQTTMAQTENKNNNQKNDSTTMLNEIVVVGYGSQMGNKISGSLSRLSGDKLSQMNSSINQILQGTISGLVSTPTSGQPGGGMSIRIRGGSSIQGGNEPLFVIDGFPVDNSDMGIGSLSGSALNPLSEISPSDIKSITILKDASATSIYGSRGANGVVLITTKCGDADKRTVTYEGNIGFQQLRKKIDVLNAHDFAVLRNEALFDKDETKGEYQYLSLDKINALSKGTDWQDEIFHPATFQNHKLSISGSDKLIRYTVSVNYQNQDGIVKHTDYKRIGGRINLELNLSEKLKVGLNSTGSRVDANVAPDSLIFSTLTMPPTVNVKQDDGSYTLRNPFENIISNPVASLAKRINKTTNYRFLGTAFGEYSLMKELKLKVTLGTDIRNNKEKSYIPSSIYEGSLVNGIASLGNGNMSTWLNENTLTYSNIFGQHSVNVLLGFTQQESKTDINTSGSSNFVSDDAAYNNLSAGSVITTPTSNYSRWAIMSYLARVNYNYNDIYFITASFRRDGSSKFGKNNKWGNFPSIGASWNISNERFMHNIRFINTLKLRTSYGSTGNQNINPYQSLSVLESVKYVFNGTQVTGFRPSNIANDNLQWETTNQFDCGFDLSAFNYRLKLTVDYYVKRTNHLLLNVEIPWTTGHTTSLQNFGSVCNKGWDIGISSKNIQDRDFEWYTDFNISFNRNKVIKINSNTDTYISEKYIIQEGKPLGTYYGCVTNGILQKDEVVAKGKYTGRTNYKAGDQLYKDINDDGTFSSNSDRTILGNAQPDFTFGMTNTIRYKDFDLNLLINGTYGNKILNANEEVLEMFTGQQNAAGCARNRWTSTHTDTNIPRASSNPSDIFSNRFLEDGSFIRIKNLTLGYRLPEKFAKICSMTNARIYLSFDNLLTLTHYSGFDPEIGTGLNSEPGTDMSIYPTARSYSIGIQIKF